MIEKQYIDVQSHFYNYVDHTLLLYFCLPVAVLEICHAFFPIQKRFMHNYNYYAETYTTRYWVDAYEFEHDDIHFSIAILSETNMSPFWFRSS